MEVCCLNNFPCSEGTAVLQHGQQLSVMPADLYYYPAPFTYLPTTQQVGESVLQSQRSEINTMEEPCKTPSFFTYLASFLSFLVSFVLLPEENTKNFANASI